MAEQAQYCTTLLHINLKFKFLIDWHPSNFNGQNSKSKLIFSGKTCKIRQGVYTNRAESSYAFEKIQELALRNWSSRLFREFTKNINPNLTSDAGAESG